MNLADMYRKLKIKFLVCSVQRGNEVYIPDGSFVIEEGDKIGDFEVIHTPGHTQGGVCFLVEGNLFSGDTIFTLLPRPQSQP